jgi:hypothetical protein
VVLTYTEALNVIIPYSIPVSVEAGANYLQGLSQQITFLLLYQDYFPAEWTQSTSDIKISSDNLKCSHSLKEMEFLQLVEERLFPIGLEWERVEELEERMTCITVYPHDLDWYQREIEEFDEFHQFAIALLGHGFPVSSWFEQLGIASSFVLSVQQLDFEKLKAICREAPEPLCYLYESISIVDHSTDCIWLDLCWESIEYFEWSKESMDFLIEQWKIAKQLWKKEAQLMNWIEEDKSRYLLLINLWNQAQKL